MRNSSSEIRAATGTTARWWFTGTAFLILLFSGTGNAGQLVDRIVAVVDDDIILWSELQKEVYFQLLQQGLSPEGNEDKVEKMRREILNAMIENRALVSRARKDSIEVDEREIEEMLREQMVSIKGGMSDVAYQEELERQGLTEKDLRDKLRKQTRRLLLQQEEMAHLSQGISVSYRDVERFRKTYADSLPSSISISHIMMRPGRDRAREKIEDLLRRLKAGADFAELAKRYSDDPGSAMRGGDLGTFDRGTMVPDFENTAFALEPGEISDIVETPLGYHIIRVEEKEGDTIHARHILTMAQATEEDKEVTRKQLVEIRERALGEQSFEELARQYSEDDRYSDERGFLGFFPRENPPPAFGPVISGLKLGEISPPFETEYGMHIVRMNDDRDLLENMVRQQKMEKAFDRMIEKEKKRIYVDVRLEE